MNNQTTKRIKESLVSSNPRGASGSDLLSVRGPNSKNESDLLSAVKTKDDSESTLSVRGPNSKDESDLFSTLKIKDDSESLAKNSFASDDDEKIKDPCAVCFTNRNFSKKATHFCNDCGLLGHFLCEQCLGFHKKFTNHKSVKSFVAAKYKRGAPSNEWKAKLENAEEELKKERDHRLEKERENIRLFRCKEILQKEKEELQKEVERIKAAQDEESEKLTMAYSIDTKGRPSHKGGKRVVAAIDIGTTHSGYAFSFKDDFNRDPTKVRVNTYWHAGTCCLMSLKTPTILLLNKDKTFKAFGYNAENEYSELAQDGEQKDYYYFKNFKMMLYNSLEIERDIEITDAFGRKMKAVMVFSIAIKYLKNHLMEVVRNRSLDFDDNDIRWVLTVPAIWNDSSKQLMRDAAKRAGIQKENLIIALEPDAASLFCMHLPVDKMKMEGKMSDSVLEFPFPKGRKYMVVDAGGETVNITIQEVTDSDKLNKLHSYGGAWGSTRVDAAFENFLATIMGEKFYERFKTEDAEDYIDLLREFECLKRFTGKTGIQIIRTPGLEELYEQKTGKTLNDRVSEIPELKDKVTWSSNKIRIDEDIFKSWFYESCTDIVQLVKKTFQDKKYVGVNTILLVGGFSESLILQEAMRRHFPDKRLIIPEDGNLMVLRGATIFGHTI